MWNASYSLDLSLCWHSSPVTCIAISLHNGTLHIVYRYTTNVTPCKTSLNKTKVQGICGKTRCSVQHVVVVGVPVVWRLNVQHVIVDVPVVWDHFCHPSTTCCSSWRISSSAGTSVIETALKRSFGNTKVLCSVEPTVILRHSCPANRGKFETNILEQRFISCTVSRSSTPH